MSFSCMSVHVGQFTVMVIWGFCCCQAGKTCVSYSVCVGCAQSTIHTSSAAGLPEADDAPPLLPAGPLAPQAAAAAPAITRAAPLAPLISVRLVIIGNEEAVTVILLLRPSRP